MLHRYCRKARQLVVSFLPKSSTLYRGVEMGAESGQSTALDLGAWASGASGQGRNARNGPVPFAESSRYAENRARGRKTKNIEWLRYAVSCSRPRPFRPKLVTRGRANGVDMSRNG